MHDWNHFEKIAALVKGGANTGAKDKNGKTPGDLVADTPDAARYRNIIAVKGILPKEDRALYLKMVDGEPLDGTT